MLTSTDAPTATRLRASYRPYAVEVKQVLPETRSFTRVTFTGPDLHRFGTAGLDQRIKLVLPLAESGLAHFPADGSWYDRWRLLPAAHRNPLRTYTVSRVRPHRREIDVDFVRHDDGPGESGHSRGPAARWLAAAAVGDRVAIVGPDAEGENPRVGIEWQPGTARTLLLAGDETAAPAICAILSALPRDARGAAFLEVPFTDDNLQTDAPAGVRVTWLARSGARGGRLEPAVRAWAGGGQTAGQTGGHYAWLAGEAGVVKRLRRFLVSESGLHRSQVTFMGYWRDGRSETD